MSTLLELAEWEAISETVLAKASMVGDLLLGLRVGSIAETSPRQLVL